MKNDLSKNTIVSQKKKMGPFIILLYLLGGAFFYFGYYVLMTDNDNKLKSWLYYKNGITLETTDFKALIVLSHEMGDGHNSFHSFKLMVQ